MCKDHSYCPGAAVINVNPEYWRIHDKSDIISNCFHYPENCLGGTSNNTCKEGLKGALCEVCDLSGEIWGVIIIIYF